MNSNSIQRKFSTPLYRISIFSITGLIIFNFFTTVYFGSKSKTDLFASTLEINKTVNNSTPLSGETFYYNIQYSCVSTTDDCIGTVITDPLPAALEFVGLTGSIHTINETYNSGTHTVTFTFQNILNAGTSGTVEIAVRFPNGPTPGGTLATNTATINATNASSANSSIGVTAVASDKTTIYKSLSGGALDENSLYSIRVCNTGYNTVENGSMNPTSITVIDTLPAGTTYISSNNSGVYNAADHSVSWSNSDITPGECVWNQITLVFPSTSFSVGDDVTNIGYCTYTPVGGVPATISDDITHSIESTNYEGHINKVTNEFWLYPEQSAFYTISFYNGSNAEIDSFFIYDDIPDEVRITTFSTGLFYSTVPYTSLEITMNYKTNLNTSWQSTPGSPHSLSANDVVDVATLGFAAGEYITELSWELGPDPLPVGAGISSDGWIRLNYTIAAGTSPGIFTNCVEVGGKGITVVPVSGVQCADVDVQTLVPGATAAIDKWYDNNTDYYSIGDTIDLYFTTGTALYSTDAVVNPVMYELLPPEMEYVSGTANINWKSVATIPDPIITVISDYKGTGRTMLKFEWTGASAFTFPRNSSAQTVARLVITDQAFGGERSFYNELAISTDNALAGSWGHEKVDLYDFDDDGNVTENLYFDTVGFNVTPLVSMESEKLVKGQLDTAWTKYPEIGRTDPGGLADYKLLIKNSGNINMTDVVVIEMMPHIGDIGVIDPSARDSRWRPNLVSTVAAPSGVTVYYSIESNPCRSAEGIDPTGPVGCTVPGWSTTPPADITSVQSLKFDFGATIIAPGDTLEFEWPMRAPIDAINSLGVIPDTIAWSSFAYIADRGDNGVAILPAEPVKVGMAMLPLVPGVMGDLVWDDTDGDGIQDPSESGIDGVTIEIYKDNGDGISNLFSDTLISFTLTIDGGLYNFSNLETGDYYLVFYQPTGYRFSNENQGADPQLDSDGIPRVYLGDTIAVTPITNILSTESDYSWDQGVFLGAQPPTPELCSNGVDDDGDGLIDCADCEDCYNEASCPDNDSDGIGDFCDLDDDNDGITDDIEALQINSYGLPSICDVEVYDFSGPVLESGVDKTVGAIYRYDNIITGVDALVEIVSMTNATLDSIDSELASGFVDAFQPVVRSTSTGTVGVEFNFKLVNTGTSTLTNLVDRIGGTAYDVDGTMGSRRESYLFESPSITGVDNPNFIGVNQIGTDIEFSGRGNYEGTGIDPDSRLRVYFLYQDTSEFTIHIQQKVQAGLGHRFYSLRFDECEITDFNNITLFIENGADSDNDGIDNHLDLDSDNDGIYDVDEAGHSAVDANNDGVIDLGASSFGNNGLYDAIETYADSDTINYDVANSETIPDSLYDAYELDADGDGCFDAEEENITDGDDDGIAGTGTPTVFPNGLVTTNTYASPTINIWQNPLIDPCNCSLLISNVTTSACLNNGGSSIATVDVEVSWTDPIFGDSIWVIANGDTILIDVLGGATSPTIVQFVVPADGSSSNSIQALFTSNLCADSDGDTYDAPTGGCTESFGCSSTAYMTHGAQNNTDLYAIDLATNPNTFDLLSNYGNGRNGLGFNPTDNYLYAFPQLSGSPGSNGTLERINGDGYTTILNFSTADSTLIVGEKMHAATFISDGTLIVLQLNPSNYVEKLHAIDVSGLNPSIIASYNIATIGLPTNKPIWDIQYDSFDGLIYGFTESVSELWVFDPANSYAATQVATFASASTPENAGATWVDSRGIHWVYGQSNADSNFYLWKYDPISQAFEQGTEIVSAPWRDGAACSEGMYLEKLVNTTCAFPGDTITYTFKIYNSTLATRSIRLTDTLSSGLTFVGATFIDSTATGSTNAYAGSNVLNVTDLDIAFGSGTMRFSEFTVDVAIASSAPPQIFNNQAYLQDIPGGYPTTVLSDYPLTVGGLPDATPFEILTPVFLDLTNVGVCVSSSTFALVGGTPVTGTYSGTGVTGNNFNPAIAGVGKHPITYTYIDPTGCTTTATDTIEVWELPTVTNTKSDVSCFGGADGSINLTVSNGAAPYTFLWDNGAGTSEDPTGLIAGTYNVTITDDNGCTVTTSETLTQPADIIITGTVDDATCFAAADGAIDVTTTGGVGAYTYTWGDYNTAAFWPFDQSTDDFSGNNHDATNTTGTVAYSADAQSGSHSFSFDGSTRLRYNSPGTFLVSAFSERTIMMRIKPSTLVGVQTIFEEGNQTNGIALRLNGNVLEGGAAIGTSLFTAGALTFPNDGLWHHISLVFDNGLLTIYLDGIAGTTTDTGLASIANHNAQGGFGSTMDGDAFGVNGVTNFYSGLIDEASYHAQALEPQQVLSTSNNDGDRSALTAGTYTVNVIDQNGCTESETFVVGEPTEINSVTVVTSDYAGNHISVLGGNDGSASVTPSGGTSPYVYIWSNGDTDSIATTLSAGWHYVTITDFQNCEKTDSIRLRNPSSLSGLVWEDTNGNGVQDAGESGILNITINLAGTDSLGNGVSQSTTSGTGGAYSFDGLFPGTYQLSVIPTPAYEITYLDLGGDDTIDSDANIVTGQTTNRITISGTNTPNVDFGLYRPATIGDYVWEDNNGDGLQTSGESSIENVVIQLSGTDGGGTAVNLATNSDLNGTYQFSDLRPGIYTVEFINPFGGTYTSQNIGSNPATDSDANSTTGLSPMLTLISGNVIDTIDAGFAFIEICGNGTDDDGDGLIDGEDPDCAGTAVSECFPGLKYYIPPVWNSKGSYSGEPYNDPSKFLIYTSFPTANINVSTADGTTFNQNHTLSAGTALTVDLDSFLMMTRAFNTVEFDKGFIVTSDVPIQVLYIINSVFNNNLITVKGEEALGMSFRTGSQTNTLIGASSTVIAEEAHFISVMATQDNTQVNFSFNVAMGGGISSPHSIILNEGETYLIREDLQNHSISGSLVTSDKPISVISGSQHTAANGVTERDGGVDHLVPAERVGSEYVVVKGAVADTMDYSIIVAIENNTQIYIDGNPSPVANINAGEYYNYFPGGTFGEPHYIRTSKTAYVYQVSGLSTGEVGMGLVSPIGDCRGSKYVEFPRLENDPLSLHASYVIIKDIGLPSLTINGVAYNNPPYSATATSIPGLTGYSSVVFDNAVLPNYSTITSDEYFFSAIVNGKGSNTGTFGFLNTFAERVDILDPVVLLPTPFYFADTVCAGATYNHCIIPESCGSDHTITAVTPGDFTASVTIVGDSCIQYTSIDGYTGPDIIKIDVVNEIGVVGSVCVSIFVCGSEPTLYGVPADITIACTDPIPDAILTSDAGCDQVATIALDSTSTQVNDGSCNNYSYAVTRVWVATDECGFTDTATQVITVIDTISPVFSLLARDTIVECDGIVGASGLYADWLAGNGGAAAADNCSAVAWTNNDPGLSDDCGASGTVSVIFTVSDACGNTRQTTADFTIVDNTDPDFTSPPDTVLYLDSSCSVDFSTASTGDVTDESDGCSSGLNATFIDDLSGLTGCNGSGVISRTWTLTDDCSNSIEKIQTISILDTISPTFTVPVDLTVYLDYSCELDTLISDIGDVINENDNCSTGIEATYLDVLSGLTDCNGTGSFIRIWTLMDDCNNITIDTQTVFVQHTIPPVWITSPSDITIECNGTADPGGQISAWLASFGSTGVVVDSCGAVNVTNNYAGLTTTGCSGTGTTLVTFTAEDACGLTSFRSGRLTIVDTTAPSLTSVNDITVDCDNIPAPVAPTPSDSCDTSVDIVYNEVTVHHPNANWNSSSSCSLIHAVTAASHDDKGTPGDSTDDEMTFTISVIGQNTGTAWSATVNGTPINGEYYKTYEFGPLLSNGSLLNFSIIDDTDGSCTVPISINANDF